MHDPFNQRRFAPVLSFACLVSLLDRHHFGNAVLARALMEVLGSTSDFASSSEAFGAARGFAAVRYDMHGFTQRPRMATWPAQF